LHVQSRTCASLPPCAGTRPAKCSQRAGECNHETERFRTRLLQRAGGCPLACPVSPPINLGRRAPVSECPCLCPSVRVCVRVHARGGPSPGPPAGRRMPSRTPEARGVGRAFRGPDTRSRPACARRRRVPSARRRAQSSAGHACVARRPRRGGRHSREAVCLLVLSDPMILSDSIVIHWYWRSVAMLRDSDSSPRPQRAAPSTGMDPARRGAADPAGAAPTSAL
jgi:hypothetical protein